MHFILLKSGFQGFGKYNKKLFENRTLPFRKFTNFLIRNKQPFFSMIFICIIVFYQLKIFYFFLFFS